MTILTKAEDGLAKLNALILKNGSSSANTKALAAAKEDFRSIVAEAKPTPVEPPVPPTPEPEPTPPATGTTWGLWYDNGEGNFIWSAKEFAAAEAEFGKVPLVHFAHELKPNLSDLNLAASHGGTPFLDWGMSGTVTCKGILAGTYDADLKGINEAIQQFGKTVYFRPLWEMNGSWYSWGQSSEYIAAWKHIYALMDAANCQLVWCHNYVFASQLAPAETSVSISKYPYDPRNYWPGEAYVDFVAFDCYVQSTAENVAACFTPAYELLRKLAPNKQIIFPEWGVTTSVANQAKEVETFLGLFHSKPGCYAHLYFDWDDGGNFRLKGSSLAAFNAGR